MRYTTAGVAAYRIHAPPASWRPVMEYALAVALTDTVLATVKVAPVFT